MTDLPLGRAEPARAGDRIDDSRYHARLRSLEADLALLRQDVKGCEQAFDAMNVPTRTPGRDRLRPTGRALELLGMYRRLHVLATEVIDDLAEEVGLDDEDVLDYLARLHALAPEAP